MNCDEISLLFNAEDQATWDRNQSKVADHLMKCEFCEAKFKRLNELLQEFLRHSDVSFA